MNNPPPTDEDLKRFEVRHPGEIEGVLRELLRTGGLVTLQADNGLDFALSRLLALSPREGHLLLDFGPDAAVNAALAVSRSVTLSATQDNVRVQFHAPTPVRATHQDGPAWRLAWPERLFRFQRREYYRLGMSLARPVRCHIDTGTGPLEATVLDMSVGGLAILAYEEGHLLRTGEQFHGCRLELPDSGPISFSLRVVNAYDVVLRNGRKFHRAGCQFVDLPASMETEIQRYIIRAQRERNSRYL